MKLITSIIFCLILPFTISAQSTEERVLAIRAEFNRINGNSHLKRVKLNQEEFMTESTDGGGELTGYFEQGKLVKITEWIGGSIGFHNTDYYFKDGVIFFAYHKEERASDKLDEDGSFLELDFSKMIINFEGRYYFQDEDLIKKIEDGERYFSREFEITNFMEVLKELKKKVEAKAPD